VNYRRQRTIFALQNLIIALNMKNLFLGMATAIAALICTGASTAPSNESIRTIEVSGNNLPYPMNVTVALPAGYANDTTRYPTVYLLHGHGGNHTTWSKLVPLDSIATAYGVIIVCPDGKNTWYWDAPAKPEIRMESFLVNDLVPHIDSCYRTLAAPDKRAITGLSMGGHGGLWMGIRHSDIFGSAGSTSGGVDIRPFPKSWNMSESLGTYDDNRDIWNQHTVASLIPELGQNQLNIIFDCGTDDFFYSVNCKLDSALNSRRIPHTYITGPGEHNGAYWSHSIIPQFDFFRRIFNRK